MREKFGINLEHKRVLVESRLSLDIARRGYGSFGAYLRELRQDPDGAECQRMINRLSTNYTFFFREPRGIDYAVRHVLQQRLPSETAPLQVWCAACASGEEAYSLSMAFGRAVGANGRRIPFEILATDINTEMLETARSGLYPEKSLASIPAEYRGCVSLSDGHIAMNGQTRAPIRWERENLLDCSRQACMDLIFCRNVMIYFSSEERERLVNKLHAALKPNGCLIVSATESIDLNRKIFEYISPAVYRKRGEG